MTEYLLVERTDIAKALNFGKYPVLTYDLDEKKGSKAVVISKSHRYGDMRKHCSLQMGYQKENDGKLWLMAHGTMVSAHVDVHDYIEMAEYANAPIIESDQEVAILCYSKKANVSFVQILKSGRVSADYSTATVFEVIKEGE